MDGKKMILAGCGCMTVIGGLMLVLGVIFLAASDPTVEGMSVSIATPQSVATGEVFDVTVTVTNERTDASMDVYSIDIGDAYLNGFIIDGVTPTYDDTYSIFGMSVFEFNDTIPPGESQDFVFTLMATQPGVYRDDIDVCEGVTTFNTSMVQTLVTAESTESSTPPESTD